MDYVTLASSSEHDLDCIHFNPDCSISLAYLLTLVVMCNSVLALFQFKHSSLIGDQLYKLLLSITEHVFFMFTFPMCAKESLRMK